MIPEWLSFGNEFNSRMKFVMHSHHKIHWFGLFLLAWFLHHIRYACATYPRLHNLWFRHCLQSRMKFAFSLHDTRMKFHTRTRISFIRIENRNDLCGNQKVVSASCKQMQKNYIKIGWTLSWMKVMWIVSRLLTIQTVHSLLFFYKIVRIKFQMYHFKFTLGAGDRWLGRGENNF